MKIGGKLLAVAGVIATVVSIVAGVYLTISGARTAEKLRNEDIALVTDEDRGTIEFSSEYDHDIYVLESGSGWNYCIAHSGDGVADPIGGSSDKRRTHDGNTYVFIQRVPYSGKWTLACSARFMVVRADYEDAVARNANGPTIGAVGAVAGIGLAWLGVWLMRTADRRSPRAFVDEQPEHVWQSRRTAGKVLVGVGLMCLLVVVPAGVATYVAGVKSFERAIASDSASVYVIPPEPTTKHIEAGNYYEVLLFPDAGPAGCRVEGPGDFSIVFSRKDPIFAITTEEGRWSNFSAEPNFRAKDTGDYAFDCGGPFVLSKKNLFAPALSGLGIMAAGIIPGVVALLFGLVRLASTRPRKHRSARVAPRTKVQ